MPGEGGLTGDTLGVGERIGYAQVSSEAHDPTTHRNALVALRVEPDRVYLDEGQSATNRARPGLRKHIKVEPARWYYEADKLGLMVWQDFVSGFMNNEQ